MGLIYEPKHDPQVETFVREFEAFTIRYRLNRWGKGGVRGATKHGWQPQALEEWRKSMRELLRFYPADRVDRVLQWYISNWRRPGVPKCFTLRTFCKRFEQIEMARERYLKSPR